MASLASRPSTVGGRAPSRGSQRLTWREASSEAPFPGPEASPAAGPRVRTGRAKSRGAGRPHPHASGRFGHASRQSARSGRTMDTSRSNFTGMLRWVDDGSVAGRDAAAHGYSYTRAPEGWMHTASFAHGGRFRDSKDATEFPAVGAYDTPMDTMNVKGPSPTRSTTWARRVRMTGPVSGAAASERMGGKDNPLPEAGLGPGAYADASARSTLDRGHKGDATSTFRSRQPRFQGDPTTGLRAIHRLPSTKAAALRRKKKGEKLASTAMRRAKSAGAVRRRRRGDETSPSAAFNGLSSTMPGSMDPAMLNRPTPAGTGSLFMTDAEFSGALDGGGTTVPFTVTHNGWSSIIDASQFSSPIKVAGSAPVPPALLLAQALGKTQKRVQHQLKTPRPRTAMESKTEARSSLSPGINAAKLRAKFETDEEMLAIEKLDAHGYRLQGKYHKMSKEQRRQQSERAARVVAEEEQQVAAEARKKERRRVREAVKGRKLQLGAQGDFSDLDRFR